MPIKLNVRQPDFNQAFAQFQASRSTESRGVTNTVSDIIERVRKEGDRAVLEYTSQFDHFEANASTLLVSAKEIDDGVKHCPADMTKALKLAAARIRDYSERQMPEDFDYTDSQGVRLGHRWTPIESVGMYVPGGSAAYPSSVLMNAIPARVAGVGRLMMVVPAIAGKLPPAILAAAHIAGVNTIYKIGGAQAIAALAFGTQTIQAVDKIVGPGNAYVSEAKRQVFGTVGIDMIAGPSEILVVADNKNDPKWIAADLLSQAEHDTLAQSILITNDDVFAKDVVREVEEYLRTLPRRNIAAPAWKDHGAIITVDNWQQVCGLINAIAPEHLELAIEQPETLIPHIRNAGAIFLGRHTPEAMGDYIAGPSHVLPTSRTARFSSGLSVYDFLKRTSIVGCSPEALKKLGVHAEVMANSEGLAAHALSIKVRRP